MSDDSDFMIDLDFTGVPRDNLMEEGFQLLTIEEVTKQAAKKDESKKTYPSLKIKYSNEEGKKLTDFMTLHPDALWRIRVWLEAITGEEIEGQINIDPSQLVGQQVGANITVEAAYNDPDRKVNKITSFSNP
jgi:hypothetical protein